MGTVITDSSAGTVALDLVTDRSIGSKVALSLIATVQMISCWAVSISFLINYFGAYKNEGATGELIITIILLLMGSHIIPGIGNSVVYYLRFKRSHHAARQKSQEENKEAWVCLRIVLTIMGLSPVGRYIETLTAIRKLIVLEKTHLSDSKNRGSVDIAEGAGELPVGSDGGRTGGRSVVSAVKSQHSVTGYASVVSGTRMSSVGSMPMDESTSRKVRRARRQFRRCEHDGALVALISGSVSAGPMAMVQLALVVRTDQSIFKSPDHMFATSLVCVIISVIWLAASLTHFYPARRTSSEPEFERGVAATTVGLALLFFAHLIFVTVRVMAISLFASKFGFIVLVVVIFHFLAGLVTMLAYRCYMRPGVVGESASVRVTSLSSTILKDFFLSYVGIFDFVNGNEGKTRLRYLVLYSLMYVENLSLVVTWHQLLDKNQVWYVLPGLCIVLTVFWLGMILLQLYYYYYHPRPGGVAICGLCKNMDSTNHHDVYVAQSVREPVFGVPVAQPAVPFWQERENEPKGSHIQNSNVDSQPSVLSSQQGSTQVRPRPHKPEQLRSYNSKTPSIASLEPQESRQAPVDRRSAPPNRNKTPQNPGQPPQDRPQAPQQRQPVPPQQVRQSAPVHRPPINQNDDSSSDDSASSSSPAIPRPSRYAAQPPVQKKTGGPGVFVPKVPHGSRPLSQTSSRPASSIGSSGGPQFRSSQPPQKPKAGRQSSNQDTAI